ncbi:MAG TPA: serine hydrolase domain-containing protein [Gemmatimonadaceae bacterium]|nr:serine hydrolase domain-containing protein [Gemmatimonadaceae bacterium]
MKMHSLRRLRVCLAAAMAVSVVGAAKSPGTLQECAPDVAALDRWLRREADTAGFSGVVLIERAGKAVLNRAYGRARLDNAFWLASTTKQFTAAAILRLVDEGKLAVSDSLFRFFSWAPRRARSITVEQLLAHTSGIPARGAANGLGDREAAARAILAEPLEHAPGTTYHYEDEDYNLLAAIVEIASGVAFEAFVERRLLIPAGLTHTGFCGRLAPNVKIAPSAGRDVPPPCTAGVTPVDWADRGATGLVGTAPDLLKWARAVRGGRILSPSSREELERGHVFVRNEENTDVYYSYGARVYMQDRKRREVWHSGYDVRVGHSSTVRLLDNGLSIVVLSNSGLDATGRPWAAAVARAVDQCRR